MYQSEGQPHYLCSDLVVLRWNDGSDAAIVNLEEIWSQGAVIQMDSPLPAGTRVRLELEDCDYSGQVDACEFQKIGHYITLRFVGGDKWSPDIYTPEYLLDPAALEQCRVLAAAS
jgi:hypothetical protein